MTTDTDSGQTLTRHSCLTLRQKMGRAKWLLIAAANILCALYLAIFWTRVSNGPVSMWTLPPFLLLTLLLVGIWLVDRKEKAACKFAASVGFLSCPSCGYDLRSCIDGQNSPEVQSRSRDSTRNGDVICPECGCVSLVESLPIIWEPWKYSRDARRSLGI